MRELRIPKRNGKFRTVVVPTPEEKCKLRKLLPSLTAMAMALDTHKVQHGFVPGRSAVTNAMAHVGYKYSVGFDLEDCFDRLNWRDFVLRLELGNFHPFVGRSPSDYIRAFLFRPPADSDGSDHIARQGLPTSPAICNVILSELDDNLVSLAKIYNHDFAYTRYADDLTFSTNCVTTVRWLLAFVPSHIEAHSNQRVNPTKTRLQMGPRRIITGVAVDDKGVWPTRSLKRRLRAARHQSNKPQARGLEEWCRLKTPCPRKLFTTCARRYKHDPDAAYLVFMQAMARAGGKP